MKIVFLGSTKFSEELLNALVDNKFEISAIFTIPQEFTVRGTERVINTNFIDLSPIAKENGIPLYYVNETNKLSSYKNIIKEIQPDIILVLGWYYIVPKVIREIPKYGACGIHASLLPKYAGWAPLVWAIINGEKETGVTFFQFDDSVDGGDIISQVNFEINNEDTIKEVYEKATIKSSEILLSTLPKLNEAKFKKQDKAKLEVWDKRSSEDGNIDFSKSSQEIYNFIRAQTLPYPCAFSNINDKKIKIINSKIISTKNKNFKCGEILKVDGITLVATKDNFLELGVIDDGEKQYQFEDYARANKLWGGIREQKILGWLLRIFNKLYDGKKSKFDRALPFGDCFVDRWEKAKNLGFGEGTSIYDNVLVLGDVSVGTNTWIGPNIILDGSGGLEIGSNCSISAGVQIYSHDTVKWSISGGVEAYEYAKTTIEDNCYIAPNVIIQKGITIGKGSVIGANSFVNKDIPVGSKAFGTPATIKENK